MHILKDENGNVIPHSGSDHDHPHHEHEHHHHDHAHHHHHDHGCEGQGCGHDHAHGDHEHECCGHCGEGEKKDETLVLLTYMIQHNEHHAAEIDEMAGRLEAEGLGDVAKQMREGVTQFQKGNLYLNLALSLYKEHGKEA